MLPPSHYQNKPVHLSLWILFFTFGHANAFRSSYTHLTTCGECASCSTYTVYQNTHMNAHKHTEYILFCSPSSLSPKQLQTQNTLSLLLSLFPPSLIRHLIASPSVLLLLLSLLSSSPACQLSSNVKQQSTPTLPSLLLLCRVEGERRRGITDNSEWGREDEREEEHKYRQQALITQTRFDSQHNPYSIHIQKTDP